MIWPVTDTYTRASESSASCCGGCSGSVSHAALDLEHHGLKRRSCPSGRRRELLGSLASQVGGTRVNVTSVLSDPNTDPHEYQSNPATARAISKAQLVIVNGAGYDTWAQSIIAASNAPNQKVLNVQELVGQTTDANPHFWYNPSYVNETVKAVYKYLVATDPADTTYFISSMPLLTHRSGNLT